MRFLFSAPVHCKSYDMQPVYLLVLQYQYQCGTTQLLKILKAKVPQRCLHVRGLQGRQYVQICTVYQTCSSWSHLALSNSQYSIATELHLDSTSAIWHYKQALWISAFCCSAPLFTASLMICSPCIYWYCSIGISVEQHSYLRYSKPKSPKDVCMLEGSRVDSTCRFALSIRHAPPDPILHFLIPSTA